MELTLKDREIQIVEAKESLLWQFMSNKEGYSNQRSHPLVVFASGPGTGKSRLLIDLIDEVRKLSFDPTIEIQKNNSLMCFEAQKNARPSLFPLEVDQSIYLGRSNMRCYLVEFSTYF